MTVRRDPLSGILTAVAEPYIPPSRIVDDAHVALMAAASVWNASRPSASAAERSHYLADAESWLQMLLPKRERVKRALEAMTRQFRRQHRDDTRKVVDVRIVTGLDGQYRIEVLSEDDVEHADPPGPRVTAIARLMSTALGSCPAVSPVTRRLAVRLLHLFEGVELDRLERGAGAIWAAAALHAAAQELPFPRPSAAQLAACYGVSAASVGDVSRLLRRSLDPEYLYAGNPLGRLTDGLEHGATVGEETRSARTRGRRTEPARNEESSRVPQQRPRVRSERSSPSSTAEQMGMFENRGAEDGRDGPP